MNSCNKSSCILIAITRDESYLSEWVDHYFSLGINKIYLIEKLPLKINKELINNYKDVVILDINEVDSSDSDLYNKVLQLVWDKYDYCLICEPDEFLDLKEFRTLDNFIDHYFLQSEQKYTVSEIPWEVYDDNGLMYHINKPIQELYPNIQNKIPFRWNSNPCSWGRSIFKLGVGIKSSPHWPNPESMSSSGGFKTIHIEKSESVIKKYKTKCFEDFIKDDRNISTSENILRDYFDINSIDPDRLLQSLKLLKKYGLSLSESDKRWILNSFNKNPLITVVIRTHNRLDQLKECIKSVKNQYYSCEILVLDDCSVDGTSLWLSREGIPHMSLRTNLGPGEILGRGKYLITTPFYILLDDDDCWMRHDVTEKFYEILIENPETDFIDTQYSFHVGYLILTELLLDCPNLSLWARDDWYFDWIKNSAKNMIVSRFNFYRYNKTNPLSDKCSQILDKTMEISGEFYNKNDKEKIIKYIDQEYYKSSPRERKVFDQIKSYYSSGRLNYLK